MKSIGISTARRTFLRKTWAIAPVAAVGAMATVSANPSSPETYRPTYFEPDEWAAISALVDGLIPHDDQGPGALEAGVAEFIDRQMETPYAYGHLWYMQGPFDPSAAPHYGYQLRFAPRELYRVGLHGLKIAVLKTFGVPIEDLDDKSRDELLHQMEGGSIEIGEIPADMFFAQLLQNTHEGYFCDPKYGGNKDMQAWRMVGFPGARADNMDWVEQYGRKYPLPPVSAV